MQIMLCKTTSVELCIFGKNLMNLRHQQLEKQQVRFIKDQVQTKKNKTSTNQYNHSFMTTFHNSRHEVIMHSITLHKS